MGLRFEDINPPKKEEAPARSVSGLTKKTTSRKTKSSKVEESTNS